MRAVIIAALAEAATTTRMSSRGEPLVAQCDHRLICTLTAAVLTMTPDKHNDGCTGRAHQQCIDEEVDVNHACDGGGGRGHHGGESGNNGKHGSWNPTRIAHSCDIRSCMVAPLAMVVTRTSLHPSSYRKMGYCGGTMTITTNDDETSPVLDWVT
jgi:hypothetical protein